MTTMLDQPMATPTPAMPELPALSLSNITGALNSNSPMRQFFLTYLRGRTNQLTELTDNDVRKLLNSPSPSVFKEMVIAVVAQHERISEKVRAHIHDIQAPKPPLVAHKHTPIEEKGEELIMWRALEDDAPKKVLKPEPRYSANYIQEVLIQYRRLMPLLVALMSRLTSKFQVLLTKQHMNVQTLARQHQLILTPKHTRHLHDTHHAYQEATTNQMRNQIVQEYSVLQGRPLPVDRLHRFFRSAPLMSMVQRHRNERDDSMRDVARNSRDLHITQQAILNPGAPRYYEMNEVLRNNPNFEFVPRPGRDRHNVSQTLREQQARTPTPFSMELRPDHVT